MIISATPYRVSFFGGGTDYPDWFNDNGGEVLGTTINHYNYIYCRFLPPFFTTRNRIVWSRIEEVNSPSEIVHPAVKAAVCHMDLNKGLEIHHMSDLPARSGLGSSSSFSVGILNALHALEDLPIEKDELARTAIHLEQVVMKETVGVQDQIHASYGGFNHIKISQTGDFTVAQVDISEARKKDVQNHILLFFTGVSRFASDIAKSQVENIQNKRNELLEMQGMVTTALDILRGGCSLNDFGRLLDESWMLKRALSPRIAPQFIDDIYMRAKKRGAIGGKLLGAGGGGFIMFFAPPERHEDVLTALSDLLHVPIQFEAKGSHILHKSDTPYSRTVVGGDRRFSTYTTDEPKAE